MLSSKGLKEIVTAARPIIERQLDDAEQIAAFRDKVADAGGDWSALKALIKAQIQDERDESGEGKRVKKILDKAGFSTDYAELLGWSNMNEKNFSAGDRIDPRTGEFLDDDPVTIIDQTDADGHHIKVTVDPQIAAILARADGGANIVTKHTEIATASQGEAICEYCNGSGDVHRIDGEWLGRCHCEAGRYESDVAAEISHSPENVNPRDSGGSGANEGGENVEGGAVRADHCDQEELEPTGPVAERATHSPEEANEMDRDTEGSLEAGSAPAENVRKATATVAAPDSVTHAEAGESPAPAFLTKPPSPLRPHCQRPEMCAGVGRTHCHTCSKALEREMA